MPSPPTALVISTQRWLPAVPAEAHRVTRRWSRLWTNSSSLRRWSRNALGPFGGDRLGNGGTTPMTPSRNRLDSSSGSATRAAAKLDQDEQGHQQPQHADRRPDHQHRPAVAARLGRGGGLGDPGHLGRPVDVHHQLLQRQRHLLVHLGGVGQVLRGEPGVQGRVILVATVELEFFQLRVDLRAVPSRASSTRTRASCMVLAIGSMSSSQDWDSRFWSIGRICCQSFSFCC